LVEAASNRAYARNIRNFLNINVVSRDEISGGSETEYSGIDNKQDVTSDIQVTKLSSVMAKKKISFELLKDKLIKEKCFDGVENMTSLDNIPKEMILNLIERLRRYKPEEIGRAHV
jgi:hypothetical protein